MNDIRAVREAYARKEISDVGWFRSVYNPADSLTKLALCVLMDKMLDTGSLDIRLEQWFIRPSSNGRGDRPDTLNTSFDERPTPRDTEK